MPDNKDPNAEMAEPTRIEVVGPVQVAPGKVALQAAETKRTVDQALWVAIRNRTQAIGFERYSKLLDDILCGAGEKFQDAFENRLEAALRGLRQDRRIGAACPNIHGTHAYNVLKLATEVFLMLEAGVVTTETRNGKTFVTLLDPDLFRRDAREEAGRLGREEAPGDDAALAKMLQELEEDLGNYFGVTGTASGPTALPYLKTVVRQLLGTDDPHESLPYCHAVLKHRFTCPSLIELIWSYWHEEGMLVQTLSAIALRFQNRRGGETDPLAQLEIDPLRPLNNLLWGYIQDELHRLSVVRRAYEYDHHYGITLVGKAVPKLRSADSRSKFLEAFHNLLYRSSVFYREDADTTVISDGFPLLNAVKEVHLLLAEGAHNQFGDLPWTARVEMLMQKWLLARPEMKEFIRGRAMVPYKEAWMGQVDAMKKLQGWTDVTITHFNDLATYGEQLLLSVRYGDWVNAVDQERAKNWARYWKPEIQGYIHAYRAATGMDLTVEPVDANPPWVHLRARLEEQRRRSVGA